jgi:hypothetical protein
MSILHSSRSLSDSSCLIPASPRPPPIYPLLCLLPHHHIIIPLTIMPGRKTHLTTPFPILLLLSLLLRSLRRRCRPRDHDLERHLPLPTTIHPSSTHPIWTIMLLSLSLRRRSQNVPTPPSAAPRPRTLRAIWTRVVRHAHRRWSELSSPSTTSSLTELWWGLRERDALLRVTEVGVGMRVRARW